MYQDQMSGDPQRKGGKGERGRSGQADGVAAQFEPNDTARFARNDTASAIAHNPRKRGDEALLASPTGRPTKKAGLSTCFLAPPVGLEPTTP